MPENEPGSSIMPGKVNPTQCEALTMVCAQVIGNDAAVGDRRRERATSSSTSTSRVIIHNVLESVRLLADACRSLQRALRRRASSPTARASTSSCERSLMLVTALAPRIGYDKAAEIAKQAHSEGTTLREAALALGYVSAEEFDRLVRPEDMLGPPS